MSTSVCSGVCVRCLCDDLAKEAFASLFARLKDTRDGIVEWNQGR